MADPQGTKADIRAAMQTDVGMVREHNEDSAYVDPNHNFFIVADGMGGHAAGEVASAMAVDAVRDALMEAASQLAEFASGPTDEGRKSTVATLEAAVRGAHQAVYDRGVREPDKQGMGTTLDVVLVAGSEAFVAHVGDSRTYLIRNGKAAQVTTDHTVAEVLVIEGKLSAEEAQISPLRTILVNAIGVAPDVGVEMAHIQLRKGDKFLVCSDGLHDYFLAEQELAQHILESEPEKALNILVELAKERGGQDNITGVVVEVIDCPPPPDGVPTAGVFEVSNGVPAPIGRDDTMPVDIADVAAQADAAEQAQEQTQAETETQLAEDDTAVHRKPRRNTSPGIGAAGPATTEDEEASDGGDSPDSDDASAEDSDDASADDGDDNESRDTVKIKRPDNMLRAALRETQPIPTVAPNPDAPPVSGEEDTLDGTVDVNGALRNTADDDD